MQFLSPIENFLFFKKPLNWSITNVEKSPRAVDVYKNLLGWQKRPGWGSNSAPSTSARSAAPLPHKKSPMPGNCAEDEKEQMQKKIRHKKKIQNHSNTIILNWENCWAVGVKNKHSFFVFDCNNLRDLTKSLNNRRNINTISHWWFCHSDDVNGCFWGGGWWNCNQLIHWYC